MIRGQAVLDANEPNPWSKQCRSHEILELIGGKWSLFILCALKEGPMRTGVMMRRGQGISQKMLTQTLRELERLGVIERRSYPEVPPRVEYSLTPLGETLSVLAMQIEHWIVDNYEQVTESQAHFDTLHAQDTYAKRVKRVPQSAQE